jgi:hypothetical protein
MTPEGFFAGRPDAYAVFERVHAILAAYGPVQVRTTKSQVAFRRRRGFAYLWLPGQYLAEPGAEVVLSIALERHDGSPRFKQVAHPSAAYWMHHLEVNRIEDLDHEVAQWLTEAAAAAT